MLQSGPIVAVGLMIAPGALLFFFQAEDGIRDTSVDWSSDVCSSDLGHAGAAQLDLEAGGGKRVFEELGALELLHAELAEIEQRVAHIGHLLRVALDHVERELLALVRDRKSTV